MSDDFASRMAANWEKLARVIETLKRLSKKLANFVLWCFVIISSIMMFGAMAFTVVAGVLTFVMLLLIGIMELTDAVFGDAADVAFPYVLLVVLLAIAIGWVVWAARNYGWGRESLYRWWVVTRFDRRRRAARRAK